MAQTINAAKARLKKGELAIGAASAWCATSTSSRS